MRIALIRTFMYITKNMNLIMAIQIFENRCMFILEIGTVQQI